MTPTMTRGRLRRSKGHISVRVAHTLLGATAGVVWLVLPMMTTGTEATVPAVGATPVAVAQEVPEEETSTADLVLPLIAAGAASGLAAYAYLRRTRRRHAPAPPGRAAAGPSAAPPASGAEERSARSLVTADDCVRTSREELDFARGGLEAGPEVRTEEAVPGTAPAGPDRVEPFARAVEDAEGELAAAFGIRRRYDEGVPGEPAARRHALAGIDGRCAEAGQRLDERAGEFDALRALEGEGLDPALAFAEARFRELTGRTPAAEATLVDLAERFPPTAHATVTGNVEQAKDRLVFATTRLNQARQSADLGAPGRAAAHLRAAESAIAQAGVFLDAVHGLAARLDEAHDLLPDALAEAETAQGGAVGSAGAPAGKPGSGAARLDRVLKAVREELASGLYDPVDALRRVVQAAEPLEDGRDGARALAGLLLARGAVADADAFVATHRGAVGAEARTRLAEARRLLGAGPADRLTADELARSARDLAEQDVLLHGNPAGEADLPGSGSAGAQLGGILLPGLPDTPAAFGGPDSRGRRAPDVPPA
ncbi:hypothetical protein [Streptomyces sp. NPDC058739]|uniref:hypothetical protein n=1 Tax=Streptomyces sp. NPDC058739 TaxID=3346618 RepID=UPI00367FCD6E